MNFKVLFLFLAIFCPLLFLSSCATLDKFDPGFIERNENNQNLKKLEIGMTKQAVIQIMGNPLMGEQFNTSSNIWFYYTDWDWADCVRTKIECTPLVFKDGVLVGIGRVYYRDYIHRDWQFNDNEAINHDLDSN